MEDMTRSQEPHCYALHHITVRVKKLHAAQVETRANIYNFLVDTTL